MRENTKGPVCERQTYSFVILLGRLFEGDGDLQRLLHGVAAAAGLFSGVEGTHQPLDGLVKEV